MDNASKWGACYWLTAGACRITLIGLIFYSRNSYKPFLRINSSVHLIHFASTPPLFNEVYKWRELSKDIVNKLRNRLTSWNRTMYYLRINKKLISPKVERTCAIRFYFHSFYKLTYKVAGWSFLFINFSTLYYLTSVEFLHFGLSRTLTLIRSLSEGGYQKSRCSLIYFTPV